MISNGFRLLCSTGALTHGSFPVERQYLPVVEYGPALAREVEGFEVMFYQKWYEQVEKIAEVLQRSELVFPAMHTEKGIGLALGSAEAEVREQGVKLLRQNCRLGQMIGVRTLILHLWGWPDSDRHLERNLLPLSACLDVAEQYEMQLAIETIPCVTGDPLRNVRRAIAQDGRVRVALDTEFLAWHGQLEVVFEAEWLWEGQEQRVCHVHIKDYDGQAFLADGRRRYLHPGDGGIDFVGFFAQLRQCRFRGSVSLEAPAVGVGGVVDVGKLRNSLDFVRKLL